MRRVIAASIAILMLMPFPAEGFFNRDCSNLQKRVSANQKKYEKAWDKYQSALGRYQSIQNPPYGADQEVSNRLRVTYKSIEVILLDMQRFPKCLSQTLAKVRSDLAFVQKQQTAWHSFKYAAPESELFDFRQYLKK